MSYIFSNILPYQTDEVDLFSDDDMDGDIQPIPREDYERLIEFLQDYNPPAILPIQIAYYAGLRIGEACGLAWQDVNLVRVTTGSKDRLSLRLPAIWHLSLIHIFEQWTSQSRIPHFSKPGDSRYPKSDDRREYAACREQ